MNVEVAKSRKVVFVVVGLVAALAAAIGWGPYQATAAPGMPQGGAAGEHENATVAIVQANPVTVEVIVENAGEVAGVQFQLRFDSAVVRAGDVSTGGLLSQVNVNNNDGWVRVAIASREAFGEDPLTLARITFDVIGGEGAFTELALRDVAVVDASSPTPQALSFTTVNGSIDVTPGGPQVTQDPKITVTGGAALATPTPTPTLTPTPAPTPTPTRTPMPQPTQPPPPPVIPQAPAGGGFISQPTPRPPATAPTPRPELAEVPIAEQISQLVAQVRAGQVGVSQITARLTSFGPQNAAEAVRALDRGVVSVVFEQLDPQFAAQIADRLETRAVADITSRMATRPAAAVLDNVDAEVLVAVVSELDDDTLAQLLPDMSPETVFRIPVRLLLDRLPQMPVEQLTPETAPQADPALPALTASRVGPNLTSYAIPQTGEITWTSLAGELPFLERMVGRFSRELSNITVRVEELPELPANVPGLGPEVSVERFFRVDVDNAGPEDMLAVHMTFSVPRSWLEQNGLHKWSVQLARFDEGADRWILFPTKRVREDEERVVYSVVVPGFSLLAIVGSSEAPQSPLQMGDLSISPTLPTTGEAVTVSARMRTTAPEAGVYPVSLWIDGTVEQVTTVAVAPGQIVLVNFTVYRAEGSYQVRVGPLLGQMTVGPEASVVQVLPPPAVILPPTPTLAPAMPATAAIPTADVSLERAATGAGDSQDAFVFITVGTVLGLAAVAFTIQYVGGRQARAAEA